MINSKNKFEATDEGPCLKLALSKGGSREKLAANVIRIGQCIHLAMTWALRSLDPVDG